MKPTTIRHGQIGNLPQPGEHPAVGHKTSSQQPKCLEKYNEINVYKDVELPLAALLEKRGIDPGEEDNGLLMPDQVCVEMV